MAVVAPEPCESFGSYGNCTSGGFTPCGYPLHAAVEDAKEHRVKAAIIGWSHDDPIIVDPASGRLVFLTKYLQINNCKLIEIRPGS